MIPRHPAMITQENNKHSSLVKVEYGRVLSGVYKMPLIEELRDVPHRGGGYRLTTHPSKIFFLPNLY